MAEKQIAYRTSIKELHELALVEGNEWQPSFLERGNRKISKVNIMGVVVSPEIERQGITIDDGTGSIRAINFNREPKKIVVGQTITVIGRIRTHNGERYISSEIMINSSENMLRLRKLELEKERMTRNETTESIEEEELVDNESCSAAIEIRKLIKEIDTGNGADIEDVSRKSNIAETEGIIRNMLQAGEIFEIRPGKLKVLE